MKTKTVQLAALWGTELVVSTAVDLTLTALFIALSASRVKTTADVFRAAEETQALKDSINYKNIKQALYNLTYKGLVHRDSKRSALDIRITKLGKKRLSSILPMYHIDRPWDGNVYLISYDIASKHNNLRDKLRNHIKKTGGALLQESLWINPYNPTELIQTFMNEHKLPATILVSRLGKDGAIGEEKLQELIHRVYHLKELNELYVTFIQSYKSKKNVPLISHVFNYLAILKSDPQLPFPLLPTSFKGTEAYNLVKAYLPTA